MLSEVETAVSYCNVVLWHRWATTSNDNYEHSRIQEVHQLRSLQDPSLRVSTCLKLLVMQESNTYMLRCTKDILCERLRNLLLLNLRFT